MSISLTGMTDFQNYLKHEKEKENQFIDNQLGEHNAIQKYGNPGMAFENTYNKGCGPSYTKSTNLPKAGERMVENFSNQIQKLKPVINTFRNEDPGPHATGNPGNPVSYLPPARTEQNIKSPIEYKNVGDFVHNNMVPFFRGDTKQNMASTGVSQGNYIDNVNVDSGFDDKTPFYDKLATFTGCDNTYMHKREVGPMYSPAEQQTGWVYGAPDFRPDNDRYTVTIQNRPDLKPCEAENVGPGLAIDPSIPAEGGFQQFTRIMPNNVNAYKMTQLQGRVNAGKWGLGGMKPTSTPGFGKTNKNQEVYGVPKNRPDAFYSQERRPVMSAKASVNKMNGDLSVTERVGAQHRRDFLVNFGVGGGDPKSMTENTPENDCEGFTGYIVGPAQQSGGSISPRDPIYMSSDNNVRSVSDCNSHPIGAAHKSSQNIALGAENYYVNKTDRGQVGASLAQGGVNLKGNNMWNNNSFTDYQKTTTKETTEKAYASNPKGNNTWNNNSFTDHQKTTTKETTEKAYAANPKGNNTWNNNSFTDHQKTTTKETTERAYVANPKGRLHQTKYSNFVPNYIPEGNIESVSLDTENNNNGHKVKTSGADTFSLRSTTLVDNYISCPGRSNIRLDADETMGKINYGNKTDTYVDGPGTLNKTNVGKIYQNKQILAVPFAAPNKLMGIDNRQTDPHMVTALKGNVLSPSFNQTGGKGEVPAFFQNVEPNNFSTYDNNNPEAPKEKKVEPNSTPVYENYTNKVESGRVENPNYELLYNEAISSQESNPMMGIEHEKLTEMDNKDFMGKAYGDKRPLIPGDKIKLGGPSEPSVYGKTDNSNYNVALKFCNELTLPDLN